MRHVYITADYLNQITSVPTVPDVTTLMLPLPSCETVDLLPLWISAYSKFNDQNWFNISNIFLLL